MFIEDRRSFAIFLSGLGIGILIPSNIFLFRATSHRLASYLGCLGLLLFLIGVFIRPTKGNRWA